ncbi:hypothetical protein ACT1U9_04105 [Streptomyces sp. BR1]|uniref:hypothetical protein n=1 Tax=Streptomyces sp. BR1 TaxID=1592323 RepID=UPI00402BDCA9
MAMETLQELATVLADLSVTTERRAQWQSAVARSVELLAPVWPTDPDPLFDADLPNVLPTVVFAVYLDEGPGGHRFVQRLTARLQDDRELESYLRVGLAGRGHVVTEATTDPVVRLFHVLAVSHDVSTAMDLPAFLQPKEGPQLAWAAKSAVCLLGRQDQGHQLS